MTKEMTEEQVDQVLDGITGDIRVGQRYYIFTVTYAYIGTVAKVTEGAIYLSPRDTIIVMNAGSANDAVTQIVNGKVKPEVWEKPGKPLLVLRQSVTALIESEPLPK